MIFDVTWMRPKGWGINTNLYDTMYSNRDEDMYMYLINDTLHTMIQNLNKNKRCMSTTIPSSDAEPGLVPDRPLPLTWND